MKNLLLIFFFKLIYFTGISQCSANVKDIEFTTYKTAYRKNDTTFFNFFNAHCYYNIVFKGRYINEGLPGYFFNGIDDLFLVKYEWDCECGRWLMGDTLVYFISLPSINHAEVRYTLIITGPNPKIYFRKRRNKHHKIKKLVDVRLLDKKITPYSTD